jgi:hypothetical protein
MKQAVLSGMVVVLVALGCGPQKSVSSNAPKEDPFLTKPSHKNVPIADGVSGLLAQVNARAAAMGQNFRVEMVEYLTAAKTGQIGRTLFASDRGNKQLDCDFVSSR